VLFDQFTVVLLNLRPDAPVQSDEEAAVLQDAHLAHLASMRDAGHMLVAGPLGHDEIRGICIYRTDPEQTRALCEQDPAVRAGRLSLTIMSWRVPAGAMTFSSAFFPRSVADVRGDG
jgi:uncharacterized protein YciI